MNDVIVRIIKEGWKNNLSVIEVIRKIQDETGLYSKFACQEFVNLVFTCKP